MRGSFGPTVPPGESQVPRASFYNGCFSFLFAHNLQQILKMPSWTHLIRFVAVEDGLIHLGQLVDTSRDVGRDSVDGVEIAAYVIDGTIFDGRVTKEVMHVKQVS